MLLPGDLGELRDAAPLSGGSICEVRRGRLGDGTSVVVKRCPYPPEVEADGLRALADAGAPVPEVLGVDDELLVLADVTAEGTGSSADWENLGAAVATLHRDVGEVHGWHRDNRLGPLEQRNPQTSSWPELYVEHRIRPYLADLPMGVRRRLDLACERRLPDLLDTDPPPSLLHGDLWSGNVVGGRWLIDPAVHRGDRELDLAYAEVFGGIPPAFTAAYAEAWPLPDGWERRRPALQLYHLLVHVRLFGSSYVGAVTRRLDDLGW